MVTIERRLTPCLAYKTIFFVEPPRLAEMVKNLRAAEIVRFFYTTGVLDGLNYVIRRERSFTVCNDLRRPLDELWRRFARYNRVEIRKAERLAGRVRIARNEQSGTHDFLSVFNSFAQLKHGVWPLSERVLRRYEGFADRLVLYLDGRPMVVNLVLRDPESGRVRGLYNASLRLAAEQPKEARLLGNLNRLLHWHNMRLYKEEGFSVYDWGGISQDAGDGRSKFKLSFGGDTVTEYTYLCAGWPRFGLALQRAFETLSARGRLVRTLRSQAERATERSSA